MSRYKYILDDDHIQARIQASEILTKELFFAEFCNFVISEDVYELVESSHIITDIHERNLLVYDSQDLWTVGKMNISGVGKNTHLFIESMKYPENKKIRELLAKTDSVILVDCDNHAVNRIRNNFDAFSGFTIVDNRISNFESFIKD